MKTIIRIRVRDTEDFNTFEYIDIDFSYLHEKLRFIVLYRPPSTSKPVFIEEYQTLLNTIENYLKKIYICGDFNLWFDDKNDTYVKHISDLMDSMNFENDKRPNFPF